MRMNKSRFGELRLEEQKTEKVDVTRHLVKTKNPKGTYKDQKFGSHLKLDMQNHGVMMAQKEVVEGEEDEKNLSVR